VAATVAESDAYAERCVRSVQDECLFAAHPVWGASLRHALTPYVEHVDHERNHQGRQCGGSFLRPTKTQRVKVRFSVVNDLVGRSNTTNEKAA